MEENEKKARSAERSAQLHGIGQNLIEKAEEVPCGLSPDLIEKQQEHQKILMEYFSATQEQWDDWKWQLSHRIQTVEQLSDLLTLNDEQLSSIKKTADHFRFSVSPYYFSLIDWDNLDTDPIALMSIPSEKEFGEGGVPDPSAEENTNPAGRIVRRYPNRVIINITNCCASFCRHCQRKRVIGGHDTMITPEELEESIEYIRQNSEIHDVLITGGDAFTLTDSQIESLLTELREIPHVGIIRFGTRMPVNMPQRVTESLVNVLKKFSPIYVNTQFNNPIEVTPDSARACKLMADNGIVLGNQMVLLKGVNNDKYVVQRMDEELVKIRVRPYYMFHPKDVKGTMHFHTSISEGIDIMEHLWGNTSGLSVPRFIVSAHEGLGKMDITRDTRSKKNGDYYELTTWEGIPVTMEDC